jgi:hypothetical protein
MKKNYLFLLCFLFLIVQELQAQYKPTGKIFKGSVGITAGYSAIDIGEFQRWLSYNGVNVTSSNFLNLGIEGFVVKNHFVAGINYRYEGPVYFGTNYGKTTPKNDKIGVLFGFDPMQADDDKHVLITVGLGYCETSARFNGNPPLVLDNYQIPDQSARLKQPNFYINPKVLLLYVKKIKLGVEAGASIYLFGNYKYGYNYTYYTYGYNSNGTYSQQSHTQFLGYRVQGIPNFGNASLNISAYIGL